MTDVVADRVPELEQALAAAEARTGLADWGSDQSWRAGLDALLDCARADASAAVRAGVRGEVERLLALRLHLVADERAEPELLTVPIERPVFIVGPPRTGTSYLHELLHLDPAARSPLAWESRTPWPAPESSSYDRDPRIAAAQERYDALLTRRPEFRSMHAWGARLPAECQELMMLHFVSGSFWGRFGLPAYTASTVPARGTGKYRTHRRVLQELQWRGPRGRWTLKSPEHLFDLPGLLASYPDACLVQTHREPGSVLPSLASLVFTNRSMFVPGVDPVEVGRSVRELWGTAFERSTADRADPRVAAATFDVSYRELLANPLGVVRTIYERFDLAFTDGYRLALEGYLERQRATRADASPHCYLAADFGLSGEELTHAFPAYRARFGALLAT